MSFSFGAMRRLLVRSPAGRAGATASSAIAGSLTRADIVAAFQLILGREPHGARDIDHHLGLGFRDRFELGAYLIRTDEFLARHDIALHAARRGAPCRGRGLPTQPAGIFLGDRVLAYTHRGYRIFLHPGDLDLTPRLLQDGMWEPHVEATLIRQLRPGARAADIGANIGYHTLSMAVAVGTGGELHAFEANPEVLPLLGASLFVNGFQHWVQVHPRAVMHAPGEIRLAAQPGHLGSGNAVPREAWSGYHASYSVQRDVSAVTLDSLFGAEGAPFDLLHLDIEGAEPLALRGAGALLARSPGLRIVAEWSVPMMAARSNVPEFVAWLAGLGFRFWRIDPPTEALQPIAADDTLNLPHGDLVISRNDPD